MIAKVTAPDLAQDVPGAEALIVRHKEHRAEIDTRTDAFTKFSQTGHKLIAEGHFLAHEIEEKISILEQRKQLLNDTWARRKAIYDQNLDTQVWCCVAGLSQHWAMTSFY
jgi:spectrin beta